MVLRWPRFAFGLLHTAVTLRNHPHGATARLLGPPGRWHGCARRKRRWRGGQEQQTGAVERNQREQPKTNKSSTLCTRPSGLAFLLCDLPLPPAAEKVPRARGVT